MMIYYGFLIQSNNTIITLDRGEWSDIRPTQSLYHVRTFYLNIVKNKQYSF